MFTLKKGIYKKSERFYQLLFVATLQGSVYEDGDVVVYVRAEPDGVKFYAIGGAVAAFEQVFKDPPQERGLFVARAHADIETSEVFEAEVAVYVPLYADKPGRRISVREAMDFAENFVFFGERM